MKKLSVLFLSLVAFGATVSSCSKDDDAKPAILGKWNYETYTYTDAEGTTEPQLAYFPNCPERKYFDFRSEGELELGIVNPPSQEVNPCKFYQYIGAWKQQENIISTTIEGDTRELALVSVSETTLVFRYPQKGEEYYLYTLKKS